MASATWSRAGAATDGPARWAKTTASPDNARVPGFLKSISIPDGLPPLLFFIPAGKPPRPGQAHHIGK